MRLTQQKRPAVSAADKEGLDSFEFVMKLKPIKSNRELNRALKRVDELLGTKSATLKSRRAGCIDSSR